LADFQYLLELEIQAWIVAGLPGSEMDWVI
jgi:hypothetical protein